MRPSPTLSRRAIGETIRSEVSILHPALVPDAPAAALSSAQEQAFSKVQIKVTKVAGNVHMLQGEDGNIGALPWAKMETS